MDGFDDLLSSHSHPFDDNPFANPFDKPRSSSPDPWSSFGHQQETHHNAFGTSFDQGYHATHEPSGDASTHAEYTQQSVHDEEALVDVHDVQEVNVTSAEDADGRGSSVHSPGFRESIEAEEAEDQEEAEPPSAPSARKDVPSAEEPQPSLDPPLISETSTPRASPLAPATVEQNQIFNSPSPPAASTSRQFISPLESPAPGVLPSFASLALGGESVGGWQDTEYSPPANKTEEETVEGESKAEPSTTGSVDEKEIQPASQESSEKKPLFQITVEDPQKVGDPIRPYILYTVHTKTTSPLFSKPSFSVLRRYSDFLWLYDTICLNNPGVIVPPVPEKNPFGRFDNLFVQQRRLALEICIQKIANHPVLSKDPDLKLFLESDNFALDVKHRKSESGGILSSIGQTLTGSRFSEVDDWFDRKKAYLDGLESQLKSLVKAIDTVSKQREELAIATGEFAQSIGELSESDLGKDLGHTLSTLSGVEKKAQDLQHTQAQEDTITIMATVEEYSRVINSVRVAFATRVRCHSQWQNAENELRRVKQSYERARSQGRIPPERTGHSLAQIAEAERRALDGKHDFERCSRLVKTELARFEEERIADFSKSLEAFLEGMIQRQRELIDAWEGYQELLLKRVNAKPAVAGAEPQTSAA